MANVDDPGPLEPVDDGTFPFLSLAPRFVDVTNGHIADTYPHHDVIQTAHQKLVEASDPTGWDAVSTSLIGDASAAHQDHVGAVDSYDPGDVLSAANAHSHAIDGHQNEYDETPPGEVTVPDPGQPPSDPGDGNGGGIVI